MKRALQLDCSDQVMQWPDTEFETDVLEDLLAETLERNLPRERLVVITKHKRVKGFDPNNPDWEDVRYARTVRYLRELYHKITGRTHTAEEQKRIDEDRRMREDAISRRLNFLQGLAVGFYYEKLYRQRT